MDTNLKTGKKIRSFLYRMIALCALVITLATAGLGREALLHYMNQGTYAFSGDVYHLTEFKELVSELYHYSLLGYAGVGDDKGYPLTSDSAKNLSSIYLQVFEDTLAKCEGDLFYYVEYTKGIGKYQVSEIYENNFSYPLFSEYDGHLLLPEDVTLCCYLDGDNGMLQFFPMEPAAEETSPTAYFSGQYLPVAENVDCLTIVIALKNTDTYSSEYISRLAAQAENYRNVLFTIVISSFLTILFGLFSILTYRPATLSMRQAARLTGRIYGEGKLLLLAGMIYLCYRRNLFFFTGSHNARFHALPYLLLYIPLVMIIYLFLNDLKYNRQRLFTHSIVYGCISCLIKYYKSVKWYRKAALTYMATFACAVLLLVSGSFFIYINYQKYVYYYDHVPTALLYPLGTALIAAGILLWLISIRLKHFISDTEAIANRLNDLSLGNTGNTNVTIELSRHSLLKKAADDLQEVEQGIEAAVEQTTKANKMRVELITNVSHDLKTPLTSIINYADMLCEETLPAPADEYVTALRAKAYRLKGMVQDVFDLSKATSGNLRVEATRLDLVKLIHQTLADMDDRIQQSTLNFKLTISEEPLLIEADGEKLYRVFQNLFVNALQYSLENSRVHIIAGQEDNWAHIKVKNISKQELDFDTTEIIERFVRADASRTSEGSGLGLSIAQSFTETCGGTLYVETDADMFTAHVKFPLV